MMLKIAIHILSRKFLITVPLSHTKALWKNTYRVLFKEEFIFAFALDFHK